MDISGLQKMTLLDYPGKVACTVFLGGCDFRCPFCHNWELACNFAPPEMDDKGLLQFLRKRQGLLDGVCISGGEPLINADIRNLLQSIRELGFSIKLDTNGSSPDVLCGIVEDGLADYVAMDIKNSPSRYAQTVGVPDFDLSRVRESVSYLLSGAVDYEFRTTVTAQLHDVQSFDDIGQWILGARRYYLQPFVMSDAVPDQNLCAPSAEMLEKCVEAVRPYVGAVEIRGV